MNPDHVLAQTKSESTGGGPNSVVVQLAADKLDKKDTFGKGGMLIRKAKKRKKDKEKLYSLNDGSL